MCTKPITIAIVTSLILVVLVLKNPGPNNNYVHQKGCYFPDIKEKCIYIGMISKLNENNTYEFPNRYIYNTNNKCSISDNELAICHFYFVNEHKFNKCGWQGSAYSMDSSNTPFPNQIEKVYKEINN